MPKSRILWVVQVNGRQSTVHRIGSALQDLGVPFVGIYRQGSGDDLGLDEPLSADVWPIFWGTTGLLFSVLRSPWARHVYFDETTFHYPTWQQHFGDLMLNADADVASMRHLAQTWPPELERRWVRSLGEFKELPGKLYDRTAFLALHGAATAKPTRHLSPDSLLLAAAPKQIYSEHRFFVVNRRIISSACYRREGKPIDERGSPPEVETFVKQIVHGPWLPHDSLVIDVAQVIGDGSSVPVPKILEFNCLNASGFYANDERAIIQAVTANEEARMAELARCG